LKLIFLNRYFHPDISATSQILGDLAIDQARRGREVHVITSRQLYEDPAAGLPAVAEHQGVRIHRVWTSRFGRASLPGRAVDYATFYLAAAAKLASLADKGSVVIAKSDPPLISVPAACVALLKGSVLINWQQDIFPEIAQRLGVRLLSGPAGSLARALRSFSARRAKVNVVLGARMAQVLLEAAGPGIGVQVIENWADGALVRPVARGANPLRGAWGLADRFVVGYSGNMGRAHEFDTLLDAAELLRGEARIAFLFVGSGRQKEWIGREAARRGLTSFVFQPYQPREMLAFSLSVADAHLVTLQRELEGLIVPSKFYGIAAAGRPTLFVGDTDGEIARTVVREGCGVAVATGDSAALARSIRQLREHPDEANGMGLRARAAFERNWDLPIALRRWDDLLQV